MLELPALQVNLLFSLKQMKGNQLSKQLSTHEAAKEVHASFDKSARPLKNLTYEILRKHEKLRKHSIDFERRIIQKTQHPSTTTRFIWFRVQRLVSFHLVPSTATRFQIPSMPSRPVALDIRRYKCSRNSNVTNARGIANTFPIRL